MINMYTFLYRLIKEAINTIRLALLIKDDGTVIMGLIFLFFSRNIFRNHIKKEGLSVFMGSVVIFFTFYIDWFFAQ